MTKQAGQFWVGVVVGLFVGMLIGVLAMKYVEPMLQ